MGYTGQTLWDTMGNICEKLWDIFVKLWDLFRKTMGYIGPKLCDILG